MSRRSVGIHGDDANDDIADVTAGEVHVRLDTQTDPFVDAVVFISEPHNMTHLGKFFDMSGTSNLANGASLDILFSFPSGVIGHLTNVEYQLENAPCSVEFYENVVTSADGTAANVQNHNRISSVTPGAVITLGPTITDIGDLLHERYIPDAGGPVGQSAGQLVAGEDNEWVIGNTGTPNKYLWRLTNNSGGAIDVGYHFNGYEPSAT